mmetsp:Transcript_63618/g.120443  ORF Transcript_63618/g.120443 Transcript_63618/m.120443 type:complete len:80 (+) Transcript_63618:97-336(+)
MSRTSKPINDRSNHHDGPANGKSPSPNTHLTKTKAANNPVKIPPNLQVKLVRATNFRSLTATCCVVVTLTTGLKKVKMP